jgi:hypothetical protein
VLSASVISKEQRQEVLDDVQAEFLDPLAGEA